MPPAAQAAFTVAAPVQAVAPAVKDAACTAAAAPPAAASGATDGDGGHVTPEAAAAGGKPFRANKGCPCPNCRPSPAAGAAGSTPAKPTKGAGSYGTNVKQGGGGGESGMVWQLGKSATQQGRKQSQQAQQPGGKAAAAQQQQGSKAQQGKGGKGGKGGKPAFDMKALPGKPLMAAPTGKQVTEAKPQLKKPKESLKVKLQKFTVKLGLVKRKKE